MKRPESSALSWMLNVPYLDFARTLTREAPLWSGAKMGWGVTASTSGRDIRCDIAILDEK